MRRTKVRLLVFLAATFFVSSPLAEAQAYSVTDLKSLPPYYWTTPLGLNESSEVVGASSKVKGSYEGLAFHWTKAKGIQSLGAGYAAAINSTGDIAGQAQPQYHAFLWRHDGTTQDLGTLGGYTSYAWAINSEDWIVGDSTTRSNTIPAFLWTPAGGMQDLGTLGDANAIALGQGINDSGQVVGWSSVTTADVYDAFSWTQSGMQDIGPGSGAGFAYAVNNSGLIVGNKCPATGIGCDALLWQGGGGGTQDLGTLGGNAYANSTAYAINDLGTVVGTSTTAPNNTMHAFLWTATRGMQDLNLLVSASMQKKWVLIAGNAINNAGQIAVLANPLTAQVSHALLLSPQMHVALGSSPNPSAVGQAVTFTATVSSVAGAPPDGEQITFKSGTTVLGTGVFSGGVAKFTSNSLTQGTHTVIALYAGDVNYASAKSTLLHQVVKP